jgi:S1-C subfamily serine protease
MHQGQGSEGQRPDGSYDPYQQYGQPDYSGQPSYGQPPYGQPSYGEPSYAQQPYAQDQFGQAPQLGSPGEWSYPAAQRRSRRLRGALAYIAVAALAAAGGGLAVAMAGHGSATPVASAGANAGSGANSGSGTGGSGQSNPYGGGNSSGGTGGYGSGSDGQGSTGGTGSGVSSAAEQKVEAAVEPGLVVIRSNLGYQGGYGEATGMVISSNGLVLTNNHVIDATTGLTATVVSTGKQYQAEWLGYDKGSDVAVIRLENASGLRTVPLGNSGSVKSGAGVVAMGNANGTGSITTVTGTITGLNQDVTASDSAEDFSEQLTGMFETDADIIEGDSGGPLANLSGQVIGMDTAASSSNSGLVAADTGFAIPINRALTIARQIIAGKSGSGVQIGSAGFLGVVVTGGQNGEQSTVTSPSSQLQQYEESQTQPGFGYGGNGGQSGGSTGCLSSDASASAPGQIASVSSGALVIGVLCSSPADSAGMDSGDVITSVDGKTVSSPASLEDLLATLKGGESVSVTWVTPAGQSQAQSMTLASAPPS